MKTFEDSPLWKRAHGLAIRAMQIADRVPEHHRLSIAEPLARSAIGVPLRIASGWKRTRKDDAIRALNVAESAAAEARYLLVLIRDLNVPFGSPEYIPQFIHGLIVDYQALEKEIQSVRLKVGGTIQTQAPPPDPAAKKHTSQNGFTDPLRQA